MNEHVEHGNQAVSKCRAVNDQIQGKSEVNGKVHGKGKPKATNSKIKGEDKMDDAGRGRGKMKMRIFEWSSL